MEKILLINFTKKDAEKLSTETGLIVHTGFIEDITSYEVSPNGASRPANPNFWTPESIYEYKAIFFNASKFPLPSDISDDKLKYWQQRDSENLLDYWYKGKGTLTVFAGDISYGSMAHLGIPLDLQPSSDTDTTNRVVYEADAPTGLRQLFYKLRPSIVMPPNQYLSIPKKFNIEDSNWTLRWIYFNANSDLLGCYYDHTSSYADKDEPRFIALPQFKNNLAAVTSLVQEFSNIYPQRFSSVSTKNWESSDTLLPAAVNEFNDSIQQVKEQAIKQIQELEKEQAELRSSYSHLPRLLTTQGDELVDSIEWVLNDIFDLQTENSDKKQEKGNRKEDLIINLPNEKVLAEIKGVHSQNPSNKYVAQVLTHIINRKKSDISRGYLIINHDFDKDPKKRSKAYTGDDSSLIEEVTYIDTRVLHALALDVLDGKLSKDDAIAILSGNGRIEYKRADQ